MRQQECCGRVREIVVAEIGWASTYERLLKDLGFPAWVW